MMMVYFCRVVYWRRRYVCRREDAAYWMILAVREVVIPKNFVEAIVIRSEENLCSSISKDKKGRSCIWSTSSCW